jgi:hypothetical protein
MWSPLAHAFSALFIFVVLMRRLSSSSLRSELPVTQDRTCLSLTNFSTFFNNNNNLDLVFGHRKCGSQDTFVAQHDDEMKWWPAMLLLLRNFNILAFVSRAGCDTISPSLQALIPTMRPSR